MLFKTTHRTPIGLLYLISSEDVLLGAGFRSFEDLLERMDPDDSSLEAKNVKTIPIISDLIADYFAGDFSALGGIKVRQPGEKFSQAIWKAMRKIPAGKTLSYSDLAARAGSPAAVRAAGTACGRNLIAPIIPCHRIIKSGGALGNYGYGLETKDWLLRHEGAL
ncbi:MAG: methylated-DNA--[protein]-cysteine S-methyltransferase [Actinobacteria bacterium]|jgi:methylated-DNA-[protein]-cysteine S-methyltransferase|nr:methylated-DNA--[protein]-cysteine S-methyltransferase [Actinomycetota bacterium]